MALPPFAQVIKARDVEDPVNIWIHRPLAYAFVGLVHKTPLTPNQITLTAMLLGIAAGTCWVLGTPELMLVGGILLWSSSILDGADGILARTKKMQSELGRALDGTADMVVAVATVFPAMFHIWQTNGTGVYLVMVPIALVTAIIHINIYDFYKELYLGSRNLNWQGTKKNLEEVQKHVIEADERDSPLVVRFAWRAYASMLKAQANYVRLTNPLAWRSGPFAEVSPETEEIYRRHNYWPMQLWSWVSLCPHTYVMAICAMFNRLDVYLWIRAIGANVVFLTAIIWQRIATARTLRDLERIELNHGERSDSVTVTLATT